MFKVKAVLLFALVTALLAACGQTPVADAPKEPGAALETAAASPYTYYQWRKGESNTKTLIGSGAGFCWLTGAQGDFDSADDQARVYKAAGYWKLETAPSLAWASATCLAWSGLKHADNAFQPTRMVSDAFSSLGVCLATLNLPTRTWWGDAATYISGLKGGLDFYGEVDVDQSRSGFTPSDLGSQNCEAPQRGEAHAMFFGKPQVGDMPQYWGVGGQRTEIATEFGVPLGNGQTTVEMAPADKAFCYLSFVRGGFDHPGDWVWLYRAPNSAGQEVWKLNVRNVAGRTSIDVWASATCYMLTQF